MLRGTGVGEGVGVGDGVRVGTEVGVRAGVNVVAESGVSGEILPQAVNRSIQNSKKNRRRTLGKCFRDCAIILPFYVGSRFVRVTLLCR